MPELLDETSQIESTTVGVYRTSATVKGGRRFSFGALVVVGDRRGRVGYGYGKSNDVPSAIEKAQKYARKAMVPVPLARTTLHHAVEGRFGASKVRLIPAAPGTGVVAGQKVRAVLELAGITDCLTKCYGSTNAFNAIKAVFDTLGQVRSPDSVAEVRGVTLEPTKIQEMLERNAGAFAAAPPPRPKPPQQNERGGGRGGRGRGGGQRRRGPRDGGAPPSPDAGTSAPAEPTK
jgi:small subunit ribosomal protein S5